MEGLIFGGAYLRREICVSKSIGLALYLEVNLPFLLCFTSYLRAISQGQAPGGLIFGGAYFRNFTYDGTNLFSLSLIYLYVYFYMFISLQIQVIGPQKQLNTSVLIVHLSNHETMRTTTCLLVRRGRVLSITVYTGRPRPQGVPFSCFLCMKG